MNVIKNINYTSFLSKMNEGLDTISDTYTERCLLPFFYSGYQKTGNLCALVAGIFSRSLSDGIRNVWVDPFSTSMLLRLFVPLENLSRRFSLRVPSQKRLFHYLDQTFVSTAQHFYAYIKEVNGILTIPKSLKALAEKMNFDQIIADRLNKQGQVFVIAMDFISTVKELFLELIDLTIKVVDFVLKKLLLDPNFALLGYLRDIVHKARKKMHAKFCVVAIQAIEKREIKLRREIVANVATFVTHYVTTLTNRVALKTGLGVFAYGAIESFIHSSFAVHKTALQATAVSLTCYFLWKNVYGPFFHEYYTAYQRDFDPDRSYLKSFLDRYYLGYLYYPLESAKNLFEFS